MIVANSWKITFYDLDGKTVQVMTVSRWTDKMEPLTYAQAQDAAQAEMDDGLDCPGAVRYELEPLEGEL